MISALGTLIRLDVNPSQVTNGLPDGLISDYREGSGFEDKLIVIPVFDEFISFQISYDGESEMIAKVHTNLFDYDEDRCEKILRNTFS